VDEEYEELKTIPKLMNMMLRKLEG